MDGVVGWLIVSGALFGTSAALVVIAALAAIKYDDDDEVEARWPTALGVASLMVSGLAGVSILLALVVLAVLGYLSLVT